MSDTSVEPSLQTVDPALYDLIQQEKVPIMQLLDTAHGIRKPSSPGDVPHFVRGRPFTKSKIVLIVRLLFFFSATWLGFSVF
jgi:hypothetical protein